MLKTPAAANWRGPLSLAVLSIGYVVAFNVFGSLGDPRGMIGAWGMRYFFLPTVIALTALSGLLSGVRVTRCVSASTVALGIVAAVSATDFFVHPYFETFASEKPSWRASRTILVITPRHDVAPDARRPV